MRRMLKAAMFVVLIICTLVPKAGSQENRNFWFLNNTNRQIDYIYVSPHEQYSWGSDVLGRDTLSDSLGTLITFPSDWQTSCYMDFKLVFDDGSYWIFDHGFNVCQVGAVEFESDREAVGMFYPST